MYIIACKKHVLPKDRTWALQKHFAAIYFNLNERTTLRAHTLTSTLTHLRNTWSARSSLGSIIFSSSPLALLGDWTDACRVQPAQSAHPRVPLLSVRTNCCLVAGSNLPGEPCSPVRAVSRCCLRRLKCLPTGRTSARYT